MKEFDINELYERNMGFSVKHRGSPDASGEGYLAGTISDSRDILNELSLESVLVNIEQKENCAKMSTFGKINDLFGKDVDKSIEKWCNENYNKLSKSSESINDFSQESAILTTAAVQMLSTYILSYLIQHFIEKKFDGKISKDVNKKVVKELVNNKEFMKGIEKMSLEFNDAFKNFKRIGNNVEDYGPKVVKEIISIIGIGDSMKAGKIQHSDNQIIGAIGKAIDENNPLAMLMKRVKFYSNFRKRYSIFSNYSKKKKIHPLVLKTIYDGIGSSGSTVIINQDYLNLQFNTNEVLRTDISRRIEGAMADNGKRQKILDAASKTFLQGISNLKFGAIVGNGQTVNNPAVSYSDSKGKIVWKFLLQIQLKEDYSKLGNIIKEAIEKNK